jgi:hypothetical protein
MKKVAQHLVVLEYFPYHSRKYCKIPNSIMKEYDMTDYLPSQIYTFHLLNMLLEKNDIIIVGLRHHKQWLNACEGLKEQVIFGKNVQKPYISPGNLGEENFKQIVNLFKEN